MYKVNVEVKDSKIDGKGVFVREDIAVGKIVWIFDKNHDKTKTSKEFNELPRDQKDKLRRVAYLSPTSGLWVYPPPGDPAEYTNHSAINNLSAKVDNSISSEPYFVSNRDIKAGEELTNNYHEFDQITQLTKPSWTS